jgi:DNA-binding GntR family transcriptional regulator
MPETPPATRDGAASARIAEALRRAILSGEHEPGERIVQEELAERYGGSRIPVREALRQLETEGLVRLVANTGAWVQSLTMAQCSEVYQTRERLEPLLLRHSAEYLTDEVIRTLHDLAQRMEKAEDMEEFLELDREFHFATYRAEGTHVLRDLVTRLWNTTQPYRRAYTGLVDDEHMRIFHDDHHMLVSALRDGDMKLAEQVVAIHIRRTRVNLERHPEIFPETNPDQE